MEISVVVPIFNEEKILPELYERLTAAVSAIAFDYELIFVNDGSRDNSIHLIRQVAMVDSRVRFISFSRNFGHQVAVMAGLEQANGKAVVIIDGDLQDPPELIRDLYNRLNEGFKIVYAKRRSRQGETWFKKATAKFFYRLLDRITSIDIPLDTGDFRIIDRKVVECLKKMPESHKFLRGQIAWTGFSQSFIEYDRHSRKAGTSGYSLKKMIRFALDGITGFSNAPLKFATIAGAAVSFVAFCVILYALYSRFILQHYVEGWTSLIISSMFIGGIQLLCLGLIGEYISRISSDVKKRPLYVVDETNIEVEEPSYS